MSSPLKPCPAGRQEHAHAGRGRVRFGNTNRPWGWRCCGGGREGRKGGKGGCERIFQDQRATTNPRLSARPLRYTHTQYSPPKVPHRHVDEWDVGIVSTRLQQQDLDAWVGREPVRQHAASAAASDNDIVVVGGRGRGRGGGSGRRRRPRGV